MGDSIEIISAGILLFLIFFGMASPVIVVCLVYYLKKRLEHKQILAAIEKGVPFSKIKPPKPAGPAWIKNLTAGIALLIIAGGFVFIPLVCRGGFDELEDLLGYFIVGIIFFAIGISRLIRGLLQRKTEKAQNQIQPSGQINASRN